MMQEGFYWVQRGTSEPEVWFYSADQAGAWFEPTKNEPIDQHRFAGLGYRVISERLSLS
ncbi:hypothetical protein [Candidatus Pantoea soli]|uniref:hypothetical protein n=1 Tax=Candidatus Pantoea soli TaxID=3098669 RepID=UPI001644C2C9|nr:hypothetical protein [Pantoea soli]